PLIRSMATNAPAGCALVCLSSPLPILPDGAEQAQVNYVHDGGNLLWLADPGRADLGLAPLAGQLGIQKLPGVLVDGQGAALGQSDPRRIAIGQYPPQAITKGFTRNTLFPGVAAWARSSLGDW